MVWQNGKDNPNEKHVSLSNGKYVEIPASFYTII